jgi:hypothetical protein
MQPVRQHPDLAPACRACGARSDAPIASVTLPEFVYMCTKHQMWQRGSHLPLTTGHRPELARAQRICLRLVRLHGTRTISSALTAGNRLAAEWSQPNHVLAHRINSRAVAIVQAKPIHPRELPADLPRFPEAVALARLLMQPCYARMFEATLWVFPAHEEHVSFVSEAFERLKILFNADERQAEIAVLSHFAYTTSTSEAHATPMDRVMRIKNASPAEDSPP